MLIASNIAVALLLVTLTMADGARVTINPQYVAKLYPTKEAMDKGANQMVVRGAKCVVTMADGKFMAVLETCDMVKLKLEGRIR